MIEPNLAKKLFWTLSLPSLLVLSLVCLYKGLNPLDTVFSLVPLVSALPLMMQKLERLHEKSIADMQEEFRSMGATEFLNFFTEFRKIPPDSFRPLLKEAYRREYLHRYGKDIVDNLPMFGE